MSVHPQEALNISPIEESFLCGITAAEGSIQIPVISSLHGNFDAFTFEMKIDLSFKEVS